jgi:hypothetical protein
MALRFRKSIKLAPGVRMNLSGGGLSWTLGPRGASIGIGKRGTYLNSGIPGTGLYTRQALSGGSSASRQAAARPTPQTTRVSLTVAVSDDGTVAFTDENGSPVSEEMIAAAKKQKGDAIRALIQKKCDEINGQVEALGMLHLDVPPAHQHPAYSPQAFSVPQPNPPRPKTPGFFDKLLKSRLIGIEAKNAAAQAEFLAELAEWQKAKAVFDTAEDRKRELVEAAVAGDSESMENFFGEVLNDIVWPRETAVSFEVLDEGRELAFDVDLPEQEDMPTKTASVPQRGYRLSVKEMSATAVQKMYAQHIHSIGFRLLGEAFGMLPTIQRVTLSGFSQRKNKSTGHEADEYLFSVKVQRDQWEGINFESLNSVDVMEALSRFELKRQMTKTGVFTPIQPF